MAIALPEVQLTDLGYQKGIATMSPHELIAHLQGFVPSYEPKFSVGDWFAAKSAPATYDGPRRGGIRFHDGYRQPMKLQERFDMYQRLQNLGLAAVEFHYHPLYGEMNETNEEAWFAFLRDTGLRGKPALNGHYDHLSEFGGLSSPYPAVRRQAVNWLERTLLIARLLGEDSATVWPGGEGYEDPTGLNIIAARERFTDSVAEAMDRVPGTRVSFEGKPYEPRGRTHYGSSTDGIIFARDVEEKLTIDENADRIGLEIPMIVFGPELGHAKMGYEVWPEVLLVYGRDGRLNHVHWNAQMLGGLDVDYNLGTVNPEDLEQGMYALFMLGYRGLQGLDLDPQRMDTERAIINSIDAMRSTIDRLRERDHEKMVLAAAYPADNRGYAEALVTRERACPFALKNLSEMPEWVEPRRDIKVPVRAMKSAEELIAIAQQC